MGRELSRRQRSATDLAVPPVDVLESWLQGKNQLTRRGYLSDLNDFAAWRTAESPEAALEQLLRMGPGRANQLVIAYRADMKERRDLSSSTINRRLAALRSMVKVGRTIGVVNWSLDVQNVKSEERRHMSGPGLADLQLMNRKAAARGDGKLARRDRAILALLFDLGLRRAELCGLDLADVERSENALPAAVWIIGKGHREKQRLTMPEPTGRALAAWLEVRGDHDGPLFHRLDGHAGKAGERFSGESVRRIVKELGEHAEVPRAVLPHGLRHSAITAALDARHGDVRSVQRFSRHSSLDMVIRYDDRRGDVAGEIANDLAHRREEATRRHRVKPQ
jgi:integrase/recombinase XerC